MYLNTLKPGEGSKKKAKRVGRGIGSGLGKTAGKGHKGQKARKSGGVRFGFEGGQTPLYRRIPKFGFVNPKIKLLDGVSAKYEKAEFVGGDIQPLAGIVYVRTE